MTTFMTVATFGMLALSAQQIGRFFARFRLPLISGYLLAGILIGPFVLCLLEGDALEHLAFIDDLSLAFIAFAAGSELFLKELRSRLKSIAWHTASLTIVVYSLGTVAVFLLADTIPFMHDMPPTGRLAAAILVASILVARSPSSAIAIVNELRARGPFTKTALGVTVVMDVVVILFFAFNTAIADILLTASGFDIGFVILVLVELPLSLVAGYTVSKILELILSAHLNKAIKTALILVAGYGVFVFSNALREYTHANLPFEILLEPLLICLIGSFMVTNFSRYRNELAARLHDVGPPIYIIFFMMVGATLQLNLLGQMLPVALFIFGVRLVGIFIGSMSGGIIAGDPMSHNRIAWMSYVTQAGVGLGLAKEVGVEFPQMGNEFVTLMISIIVLSQIIGPPLFKMAIRLAGESHEPGQPEPDITRDVLIFGIDDQSLTLARQLKAHNWQVTMADTDRSHVDIWQDNGIPKHYVPEITEEAMSRLVTNATDALVVMCGDDDKNYRACEIGYERFGIQRLIVRANNLGCSDRFTKLGALVVEPASAMVHLLDHFVRAPLSATMLFHRDPDHEIVEITVTDPDIDGLALRDLRLPSEVLVLGISRNGHAIVPQGHTVIHLNDSLTFLGHPENLGEITVKLGY